MPGMYSSGYGRGMRPEMERRRIQNRSKAKKMTEKDKQRERLLGMAQKAGRGELGGLAPAQIEAMRQYGYSQAERTGAEQMERLQEMAAQRGMGSSTAMMALQYKAGRDTAFAKQRVSAGINEQLMGLKSQQSIAGLGAMGNIYGMDLQELLAAKARKAARKGRKTAAVSSFFGAVGKVAGYGAGGGFSSGGE